MLSYLLYVIYNCVSNFIIDNLQLIVDESINIK